MATLGSGGISVIAGNALSIVLAMPLIGIILRQAYPFVASMSAAEAVTFFGIIGGASGMVSQIVAANQLDRLPRPVNALELIPAIIASILASGVATYALVPPNPNPMTATLETQGALPSGR